MSRSQGEGGRRSIDPPVVAPDLYDADYFLNWAVGAGKFSAGCSVHGRYHFAAEMIDLPPGGTLVDVGCGRGELLLLAVEGGAGRAIGVEYAKAGVELAVEFVENASLADRCEIHLADARALPFEDDIADVVTMMDVIEHLTSAEQKDALREARRVLRPGGMILLHTFPNRRIYEFYGLLRRLWPGGRKWPEDPRNQHEHAMHVGELTGSEIKDLLAQAGFRDISVQHLAWIYTNHIPARSARRAVRVLARLPLTQSLTRASLAATARA